MTTRCPFAEWKPIGANHSTGGRQRIRGFVPHVQVGTGSLYGYFNKPKPPGQGASADFWCPKSGLTLEQYVDLADQSWAQGSKDHNGNPYMVSCEFEGTPDEPMTDAQLDMGGRLIAWVITDVNPFALVVNHTPGAEGITPHYVFGGGHTCPNPGPPPGPRELQFPDLAAAANRWLGQTPPPPPTEDDMPPAPCFVEHPTRGPLVFVVGDDQAAWEYADGKAPRRLDGIFTSGLAARLLPDGGLALYGRGDDGALWRLLVTSDGKPAGLAPMGGHIFPP